MNMSVTVYDNNKEKEAMNLRGRNGEWKEFEKGKGEDYIIIFEFLTICSQKIFGKKIISRNICVQEQQQKASNPSSMKRSATSSLVEKYLMKIPKSIHDGWDMLWYSCVVFINENSVIIKAYLAINCTSLK